MTTLRLTSKSVNSIFDSPTWQDMIAGAEEIIIEALRDLAHCQLEREYEYLTSDERSTKASSPTTTPSPTLALVRLSEQNPTSLVGHSRFMRSAADAVLLPIPIPERLDDDLEGR